MLRCRLCRGGRSIQHIRAEFWKKVGGVSEGLEWRIWGAAELLGRGGKGNGIGSESRVWDRKTGWRNEIGITSSH